VAAEGGALYRGDVRLAYLSLAPSAIILLLLSFLPALVVLDLSLRSVETGESTGPFVGLENYLWALATPLFAKALVNSLIWTFGSVALEMVIGVGLALLLDQSFRFRGLARAAILAPYLVPTVVACEPAPVVPLIIVNVLPLSWAMELMPELALTAIRTSSM